MYFSRQLQLYLLLLFLIHNTVGLFLEKKSCYNVWSYHISGIKSSKCYDNSDILSNNVTSMIQRHGYDAAIFSLTTTDGYMLKLFRISSSKASLTAKKKIPVFVLHGIIVNVETWVDIGNRSLAFNLVDKGYDVWLGTFRGTMNANKHKSLTVKDPEYWNFNLDTLTKEDTSQQLEFVANRTKQKVIIVAHSMGTTLSFMYAAENAEKANRLIKGIIAMAPVAYLDDAPIALLAKPWGIPLIQIFKALNIKGLLYQEKFIHYLFTQLCKAFPEVCYGLFSTLSGITVQFAPEDLLLVTSYWPSGTSVYVLEHFLQIARDRRFQKFNHGTRKNKKIYGSAKPPLYNLTNIQIPACLLYGKHDFFNGEKTRERLFSELGSSQKYKISIPRNQKRRYDYSHVDFIWSKNLRTFLYEDLFEKLDLFSKIN